MFKVDDEVYFNDPDNTISSGYYYIESILSDKVNDDPIVILRHNDGYTIEAFMSELS